MKNTLVIASHKPHILEFVDSLNIDADLSVSLWDYHEINIEIKKGVSRVSCGDESLTDFDEILVLAAPDRLHHVFSTIGLYAEAHGLSMHDHTFGDTSGKLYQMMNLQNAGLNVPDTFYGTPEFLEKALFKMGGVGVLKSTHGTKGNQNYLVNSPLMLRQILAENEDTTFILQNFIKNDGDYREIVINYTAYLSIFRSSGGKDHRNNTSLGGSAKIVEDADEELLRLAESAARVMKIEFAGVDVMKDQDSGEYYILEINRTPQFASGSFVDEKTEALKKYLKN